MKIQVKCFATLACKLPENADEYELPDGATVADVITALDIPDDDIALIFVNAARAYRDTVLKEGDRLGLFPPVGGG